MSATETPNASALQPIPARVQPRRTRISLGLAWGVPILVILLLIVVLGSPIHTARQPASHALLQATSELLPASALVYAQASSSEGVVALAYKPASDAAALSNGEAATLTGVSISAMCEIAGMWPSPRGKWIAIQVSCEGGGYVQAVETSTGQVRRLSENLGLDAQFLSWSPSEEMIVRVDQGADFAVYRLHLETGEADLLPIPGHTYNLAYSPDASRMIYSLTYGLGYGSQTWIADADGQNARLALEDPQSIIAFARWSPTGDRLAYIRMTDSNIPFTVGELWLADGDGNNPVLVGQADAGHGYEPAWSPDGMQIAYVGRENGEDIWADQEADRLVSNIYVADMTGVDGTPSVQALTQFEGALTEAPRWSPDGQFLAFATIAGGSGMDVWVYDRESGQVQPVTNGANARYPLWLGSNEAAAEPLPPPEDIPGEIPFTEILSATPLVITEPVTPTIP